MYVWFVGRILIVIERVYSEVWVVRVYILGEGNIYESACLHTLATDRSVKTSLAGCADSICTLLPSIHLLVPLTPS